MCRVVNSPSKRQKLLRIGKACKNIRISKGYTQQQVGEEVGEPATNISAFEGGRNNSAIILMWYVKNGYGG